MVACLEQPGVGGWELAPWDLWVHSHPEEQSLGGQRCTCQHSRQTHLTEPRVQTVAPHRPPGGG